MFFMPFVIIILVIVIFILIIVQHNLRKKEIREKTEKQFNNTEPKTEIKDEDVTELIQQGLKKAMEYEQNSTNPKFHRTPHEEELEFQFSQRWEEKLEPLIDKFETAYYNAYKINDLDLKIEELEKALSAFQAAKQFCYNKSKGGMLYFQDMWENMHNSQNERYSYEDLINDAIEEAEQNKISHVKKKENHTN